LLADTRSKSERDAAVSKAQKHFAASEQRDASIKQMIEDERAAIAVRTAKLRALRLAKEEADRIAAANAPKPEPKASAKRKRAVKAG
jgi:hypothetical protein